MTYNLSELGGYMKLSFLTLLQDGQHYMKLWPEQKVLNSFLPEGRVIAATKLAIKVMPPLAIVSCASLLQVNGNAFFPQALAVGAFFLTMPLQGLMWLGHRSNQPLPPGLNHWYKEIHEKMSEHGCRLEVLKRYPKYRELARLLKTAFKEMDSAFTQQMF